MQASAAPCLHCVPADPASVHWSREPIGSARHLSPKQSVCPIKPPLGPVLKPSTPSLAPEYQPAPRHATEKSAPLRISPQLTVSLLIVAVRYRNGTLGTYMSMRPAPCVLRRVEVRSAIYPVLSAIIRSYPHFAAVHKGGPVRTESRNWKLDTRNSHWQHLVASGSFWLQEMTSSRNWKPETRNFGEIIRHLCPNLLGPGSVL